jgi:hypothetical protein
MGSYQNFAGGIFLLNQRKIKNMMLTPFDMADMVTVLGQKYSDCDAPRPDRSRNYSTADRPRQPDSLKQ